jgi:hypothetical protein
VLGQLSKVGKLITDGSQGCAQRDITNVGWVYSFLLGLTCKLHFIFEILIRFVLTWLGLIYIFHFYLEY